MKWIGLAYEKNAVTSNLPYIIVILLFAFNRVVRMAIYEPRRICP